MIAVETLRIRLLDFGDVNDDLPCQELVELVTDYLEGRLPPLERLRFEAHLAQCGGCRTYLEQMRQTIRALGRLTEDSICDALATRNLMDGLREAGAVTGGGPRPFTPRDRSQFLSRLDETIHVARRPGR